MKKIILVLIACIAEFTVMAQLENMNIDYSKDTAMRAAIRKDSLKIENQYAQLARWQKLIKAEEFPVVNAGGPTGVFPVADISEFPDASMKYKLLFEIDQKNPDSLMGKADENLMGVARIINLHVGAGVPIKNISVVIVVHGAGNSAILKNALYKERFGKDNPNLKLIADLEKAGAQFIVCGQSMDFGGLTKGDILPTVKIAFSAQTTLTTYQLRGYVLKTMHNK